MMYYDIESCEIITSDTIATIKPEKTGFTLTLYDNKRIIYSGFYKTFKGVKIAQTKRINNYFYKKREGKTMLYYIKNYYTEETITCTDDFELAKKLCISYKDSIVTDENNNVYYMNIDLPF